MLQTIARQGVSDACLDLLFREARTYYGWLARPVPEEQLRALHDLARMPPTSSNINPQRIIFVVSAQAKERLRRGLKPGNVDKAMAAPVTAILGIDMTFFDHLEKLAPHAIDKRAGYLADPDLALRAAFRNATLQGAYLMMAARALGLDCGPMSGFKNDMVDAEFFPDGRFRSNFLCCLGRGDPKGLEPRLERFAFDEVCRIV
jgi:3-hydroxypropanoate dehydrogenase